MSQIKIGDFVTGYGSGYWQLIDIKPHIATDDYNSEDVHWKKGQVIGQWAVLKKCFTTKMKPRIDFSYEDSRWINPVSHDTLLEIEKYFGEHPDYKQKFDTAEVKLPLSVTNIWIDLPKEKEDEFKTTLKNSHHSIQWMNFGWWLSTIKNTFPHHLQDICLIFLRPHPGI